MLKYISIREDMSTEYFLRGGALFINAALPKQRILEIIKKHLDLK